MPWPRPLEDEALAAGWTQAWQALGRSASACLRETLEAAWREPHRGHHDHDAPPADRDAALRLDIDLAILGSPPGRFDRYEREVRKEYGHVPENVWRTARAAVLRSFLARLRLYHPPPAVTAFEAQARRNLVAALARLAV